LFAVMAGANALSQDKPFNFEGILEGTYQQASPSHVGPRVVESETTAQLYLFASADTRAGSWNAEIRAGKTPRENGVSAYYGANGLVGETLDPNGHGRLAATQLFYEVGLGNGQFRAGLLDPTAVLDASEIANDEYTQFMADAFVNNPSISFPSYVLGASYQGDVSRRWSYRIFVSSDSGLEAPGDPTYHNVFDVTGDRGGYSKGAFTMGELQWNTNGYTFKAGLWYDTGAVHELGSGSGTDHGYGVYAVGGMPIGNGRLLARAGLANGEAQAAADFVSLAYELPVKIGSNDSTLAFAVARTGHSDELAQAGSVYQAEAYWRIHAYDGWYITPDLQYFHNPGFNAGRDDGIVAGVRGELLF
jgi:hypothetical protein